MLDSLSVLTRLRCRQRLVIQRYGMLDCPVTDFATAALEPAKVDKARVHFTEWDEAEELAVVCLEIELFRQIVDGCRTALSNLFHDPKLIFCCTSASDSMSVGKVAYVCTTVRNSLYEASGC